MVGFVPVLIEISQCIQNRHTAGAAQGFQFPCGLYSVLGIPVSGINCLPLVFR